MKWSIAYKNQYIDGWLHWPGFETQKRFAELIAMMGNASSGMKFVAYPVPSTS